MQCEETLLSRCDCEAIGLYETMLMSQTPRRGHDRETQDLEVWPSAACTRLILLLLLLLRVWKGRVRQERELTPSSQTFLAPG